MIDLVKEIIRRIEAQHCADDLILFEMSGDGSWNFTLTACYFVTTLYRSEDLNLSELLEQLKGTKKT
jgi:hypothetical protein